MTSDEFLAWDATQTEKREFVAGEVFAMAGVEDGHATAALDLAMALKSHLAGTACRTFLAEVKVFVEQADAYFYPEVFVTCSEADRAQRLVKSEPLLVDVTRRRCDLYRKGTDGLWVLHPCETGESLNLASVALDVPAEQLFADIDDEPA